MKTWTSFEVTPWLNNETNLRLKGRNIKEFTRNTHLVCQILKELIDDCVCDKLTTALYAFEKIHCFLEFFLIDEWDTAFLKNKHDFTATTNKKKIATRMIDKFESLSDQLFKAGMIFFVRSR